LATDYTDAIERAEMESRYPEIPQRHVTMMRSRGYLKRDDRARFTLSSSVQVAARSLARAISRIIEAWMRAAAAQNALRSRAASVVSARLRRAR
jgi:hypothetical protein